MKKDVVKCWDSLMKKGVRIVNGVLQIKENSLGIKCWGDVDYLVGKGYKYTIIP